MLVASSSRQARLRRASEFLGERASIRFRRFAALFRKYSDSEPRIPAGQPEGGQWTFGDGAVSAPARRIRLAQNRPRGQGFGAWPDATPGQQAELAATQLEAQAAIARVRQIEGGWRPEPGIYENIEGEIAANKSVVSQADDRMQQLGTAKATPGPYANESVPAPAGRTDAATQREVDRIGEAFGCHTCGTFEPGTISGRFVGDHQAPTKLRGEGEQNLYPQCLACSLSQGGRVNGLLRRR